MENYYTEDLSKFGVRERNILIVLLIAWRDQGLPADFSDEGVKPAMNLSSGYVFLTNDEHQVAMMRLGMLETFYFTPYDGHEGFFIDLMEEYDDMHQEDKEYLDSIKEYQ